MYFRKYSLRKTWLDNCLERPISEGFLTGNMVNGPRHCWNLNKSTITIFINCCEGK